MIHFEIYVMIHPTPVEAWSWQTYQFWHEADRLVNFWNRVVWCILLNKNDQNVIIYYFYVAYNVTCNSLLLFKWLNSKYSKPITLTEQFGMELTNLSKCVINLTELSIFEIVEFEWIINFKSLKTLLWSIFVSVTFCLMCNFETLMTIPQIVKTHNTDWRFVAWSWQVCQ